MDFRQIEAFVKVVELASFSKAADVLHISQPSVSNYVSSLEKALGTVLINRSTKVLSTTLAGQHFLEQAKKMMALKQESITMLKNLEENISGEIRILASSVPALYILPPLLAKFNKAHPNIFFTMSQKDTAQVVAGLETHKADIGFVGSIINSKKCEFVEFADDEMTLIAPNDGIFCENRAHCLNELLSATGFVSREQGSGTRIQYEKFFQENGVDLEKIKFTAWFDNTYSIISAVAHGLGVSMVSALAAKQMLEQKAVLSIRLKKEPPKRKICMALNKNAAQSHLLRLFIRFAKNNSAYT